MELVSVSQIIPHGAPAGSPRSDFLHRIPPHNPRPRLPPQLPPGWRGSVRSRTSVNFEATNSGIAHNQYPGETQIKIDYSRIITFFDPALRSLVEARARKSRDEFRLNEISKIDTEHILDQLTDMLTRDGQGSGVDWGSVTQVIIDRYGKRLELLRHVLRNPESKRNVTEQVAESRSQVLILLTPYMLTSAIPPNLTDPVDRSWVDPIVERCASTHSAWPPEGLLTPQEKLIKRAVEGVLLQICSVLGNIWVDAFDSESAGVEDLERFLLKWESDVADLMDWLDWSIWSKCDPSCGPEVSSRVIVLRS